MTHDVVSLGPHAPFSAPPSSDIGPAERRWEPAPPPPASREPLPSVIVDVGDEVEQLVAALRDAGPEDEMVILPLLAVGEAALPALAREFPGKLWFDRNEPHAQIPAGRDVSPITRTLVAVSVFRGRWITSLPTVMSAPGAEVTSGSGLLA